MLASYPVRSDFVGSCETKTKADVRRMNVALTRARASLFVLGHCPTLERSDKTWKDIITDARDRGCLIEVGGSGNSRLHTETQ